MSPQELINAIELSGGVLEAAGRVDRLRYRLPAHAATLLDELRRMKLEVIPVLRRRSFTHLLPFLGKRVWTPAGPARLERLEDYALVEMPSGDRVRWYDAAGVIPYA